jgi:putative addiction module killer protein
MKATPRAVLFFRDARGREPFTEWLARQDRAVRSIVLRRLGRVADGLPGDAKRIGDGIYELRFSHGAGWRVYFGQDGATVVVILCAGDKGSQRHDIERAKAYWRLYLEARS